jgi:hypothetical protein
MIGIYKTLRRALAAFSLLGVLSSHGASVSDGFEETVIVDSINAATTFTILPDGRVLFAEQTGYLRMPWIFLIDWIPTGNVAWSD